jgi:hypothetical protein
MKTRKCQCLFVPPHVLGSIARSGREDLRESALDYSAKQSGPAAQTGHSSREIF